MPGVHVRQAFPPNDRGDNWHWLGGHYIYRAVRTAEGWKLSVVKLNVHWTPGTATSSTWHVNATRQCSAESEHAAAVRNFSSDGLDALVHPVEHTFLEAEADVSGVVEIRAAWSAMLLIALKHYADKVGADELRQHVEMSGPAT